MATNKKTVFVNIISTDIPIGLRNWDVKEKYIYQIKQKLLKKQKIQGRCFNSVRKIKKISVQKPINFFFWYVQHNPHTSQNEIVQSKL